MDFASWTVAIKQAGGVPTTWPFDGYTKGMPAARFTKDQYAAAQLGGVLSGHETTEATNNGDYIYVLFENVTNTPHTMTPFEAVENSVFTTGDEVANAVGLPSLDTLHNIFLAGALVVGGIVLVGLLGKVNEGTS